MTMLNKNKNSQQVHPTTNSSNNAKTHESDSIGDRLARTTNNSYVRVKGFVKKSDKQARKRAKELQLLNRKKQFGVEYMNLMESESATEQDLQSCLQKAQTELNAIRQEIAALEGKIQRTEEKTKNKILLSKKQQEQQAANTTPTVVVSDAVSPADYDPTVVATTGLETPTAVAVTATAPTYEDVHATQPNF